MIVSDIVITNLRNYQDKSIFQQGHSDDRIKKRNRGHKWEKRYFNLILADKKYDDCDL